MILADFSQLQHQRDNNRIKKENLNNTRNVSSSIKESRGSHINISSEVQKQKTVYSYMNELGIGNIEEFYSQEQSQRRKQLLQKQKQEKQQFFQQSIQRLYSTGLNLNKTTKEQLNKDSNQQSENHSSGANIEKKDENQVQYYYNEVYSEEEGFDHKFRLRMLQTECHKMREKLFNRFAHKYDLWLAQNQQDQKIKLSLQATFKPTHPHSKSTILLQPIVRQYFIRSLITFLFNHDHKSSKITTHQRFFSFYSDFINKFKLNKWQTPVQNREFDQKTYQALKNIAKKLPFVYSLVDFGKLENFQEVKFKNLRDVERWVNQMDGKQRDWETIYKVFQQSLHPKFTVPYQTKLYQVKKPIERKSQTQKQDQNHNQIKANPIPPSTYTAPQPLPQSEKKPTTQPAPFNFTQTHSNIPKLTSDQLYSWDRNFKAKPVPKTVYQPQLIGGVSEKEKEWAKKAHMEKLYHEAKYPQSMAYLQNYGEVQERKKMQLEQKYIKDKTKQRAKPKPVPDFQKIHHQQRKILEQRKEMNRTNTQPKPFKFTQTKKSDLRNTLNAALMFNQQLDQEFNRKVNKKPASKDSSMPEAKSTAKFDAYITMRKEQRQEKKAEIKQREEMKKRKENDMKCYKEILKQRMQNELVNQPKAQQYNTSVTNNQNLVKVNLQQIYLERPLLMQGKSNNNKGKKQDDQKTCYTDEFQPII